MTDSDSDTSFESADEGETVSNNEPSSQTSHPAEPTESKPNSSNVEDVATAVHTPPAGHEGTSEPSESKSSGWGWGGWSSSFINTATSSVGLFTEQLKQGLNVVMDTVEVGLGAPSPEELANKTKKESETDSKDLASVENDLKSEGAVERDVSHAKEPDRSISLGRLMSGVSSLTGVLEQTGSKVIKESLDTLELFGRKTMDVLQEGDPGLKRTRAFLDRPKANLSQVLREAKEDGGHVNCESTHDHESEFEEFQGLVHLEALEMLSKQCEGQLAGVLRTLTESEQREIHAECETVKQLFDKLEDDLDIDCVQDFEEMLVVTTAKINDLGLSVNLNRLSEIWSESKCWLHDCNWQKGDDVNAANVLYKHAIQSIQNFATHCVQLMHKLSELLLLSSEYGVNWPQEILK